MKKPAPAPVHRIERDSFLEAVLAALNVESLNELNTMDLQDLADRATVLQFCVNRAVIAAEVRGWKIPLTLPEGIKMPVPASRDSAARLASVEAAGNA